MGADQAREHLGRDLRQPINDLEWQLLDTLGFLTDLDAGQSAYEQVKGILRLIRQSQHRTAALAAQPPTGTLEPSVPDASSTQRSTLFARAVSENVAAIATDDEEVQAFRSVHLPTGLLPPPGVLEWVEAKYKDQGGDDTSYAIVTGVPEAGWDEDNQPAPPTLTRVLSVSSPQLTYVVPGEQRPRTRSVHPGSDLDHLRYLSVQLAAAHGWDEAQAATFVLTGMTPIIGLIRVTSPGTRIRHRTWCAWGERVKIDAHLGASPEEVMHAYAAARRRADDLSGPGTRVRGQSHRQLRLAAFIARQPDGPWADHMAEWNATCPPSETYSQVSNFRRDARLAQARVLYRGAGRRTNASE